MSYLEGGRTLFTILPVSLPTYLGRKEILPLFSILPFGREEYNSHCSIHSIHLEECPMIIITCCWLFGILPMMVFVVILLHSLLLPAYLHILLLITCWLLMIHSIAYCVLPSPLCNLHRISFYLRCCALWSLLCSPAWWCAYSQCLYFLPYYLIWKVPLGPQCDAYPCLTPATLVQWSPCLPTYRVLPPSHVWRYYTLPCYLDSTPHTCLAFPFTVFFPQLCSL